MLYLCSCSTVVHRTLWNIVGKEAFLLAVQSLFNSVSFTVLQHQEGILLGPGLGQIFSVNG